MELVFRNSQGLVSRIASSTMENEESFRSSKAVLRAIFASCKAYQMQPPGVPRRDLSWKRTSMVCHHSMSQSDKSPHYENANMQMPSMVLRLWDAMGAWSLCAARTEVPAYDIKTWMKLQWTAEGAALRSARCKGGFWRGGSWGSISAHPHRLKRQFGRRKCLFLKTSFFHVYRSRNK